MSIENSKLDTIKREIVDAITEKLYRHDALAKEDNVTVNVTSARMEGQHHTIIDVSIALANEAINNVNTQAVDVNNANVNNQKHTKKTDK